MKYHPILFSTPMVQGIDENRKTQTRRTKGLELFNEKPDSWRYDGINELDSCHYMELVTVSGKPTEKYFEVKCPYNVGDVLWVRETFFKTESYPGSDKPNIYYKAKNDFIGCNKWKPSLFMPKIACRTFLKIKSIRAERLLDISEGDAILEGIEVEIIDNIKEYKNYMAKSKEFSRYNDYSYPYGAKLSFISLWESINGTESLEKNPFVWVYEFEKIEKPLDFLV